jgi:hypothetical protein
MARANPNVLLVEGDEDKRVMPFLLDEYVVWGDKEEDWVVEVKSLGGIEELLEPGNIGVPSVARSWCPLHRFPSRQGQYPHVPGVARSAGKISACLGAGKGAGCAFATRRAICEVVHRPVSAHSAFDTTCVIR